MQRDFCIRIKTKQNNTIIGYVTNITRNVCVRIQINCFIDRYVHFFFFSVLGVTFIYFLGPPKFSTRRAYVEEQTRLSRRYIHTHTHTHPQRIPIYCSKWNNRVNVPSD